MFRNDTESRLKTFFPCWGGLKHSDSKCAFCYFYREIYQLQEPRNARNFPFLGKISDAVHKLLSRFKSRNVLYETKKIRLFKGNNCKNCFHKNTKMMTGNQGICAKIYCPYLWSKMFLKISCFQDFFAFSIVALMPPWHWYSLHVFLNHPRRITLFRGKKAQFGKARIQTWMKEGRLAE